MGKWKPLGEDMAKIVFAFCSPFGYCGPVSFQQVPCERLAVQCSKLRRT